MEHFPFPSEEGALPLPGDPERARIGLERWSEAIAHHGDAALARDARDLIEEAGPRRLIEAIFGGSPYLAQCAVIEPAFFGRLLGSGPDAALSSINQEFQATLARNPDRAALARTLRRAKRQASMTIALADIAGLWPLEKITGALSDFADMAVSTAARHLLAAAHGSGEIDLPEAGDPEKGSGLIVLGVGKLGAGELNYSSDIDLIVFYDGEVAKSKNPDGLQQLFVRLTQDLVKLLADKTGDGYVFRTDLRVRPDPGATPPALSVMAAETYYETLGQNWERAALIKARQIAGDRQAGALFLANLAPFIWRKHLDFAAIQDIHSIKRQINAHHGGAEIAVAGHNIKLGRGGIREIEFFAQTQQLIWGGRDERLRAPVTRDALAALARAGHVSTRAAEELTAAYEFLRRLEHRLQMIDDRQTHELPDDEKGLAHLATFLGFAGSRELADELVGHLRRVEGHYARLFEDAPSLGGHGAAAGNLIFTGTDEDPDTLETIRKLGFAEPKSISAMVRGWHHGRYRAMRSERSRQLLTELMPVILTAFGKTPDANGAFIKFNEFLSNLPSGVQLFSMFHAKPELLELLAEIMGSAPRLADHLSHHPAVLDSVLEADFLKLFPPVAEMSADLDRQLDRAEDFEEVLNQGRRWANDRKLQIGIQMLRNLIDAETAAGSLSLVADVVLDRLRIHVEREFAARHGTIEGSQMAILALGKLGSREMTPSSDLDLIHVYDHAPGVEASVGPRPLPPSQYFARLTQRLINALTAPTAEGRLYEVDMRLRPSGSSGPIASSLAAFIKYHQRQAWTWEHLALARARVISAPDGLRRRIESVIRQTLTRRRDADGLLRDVAEMRARMDSEHHSEVPWEVKHIRGGLVDVEFITQYLLLKHAPDCPEILATNTRRALVALGENDFLERREAEILLDALELWHTIQGILRLTVEGYFREDDDAKVPEALKRMLVQATGSDSFAALKERITVTARRVHALFVALIEEPAARLAKTQSEDLQ